MGDTYLLVIFGGILRFKAWVGGWVEYFGKEYARPSLPMLRRQSSNLCENSHLKNLKQMSRCRFDSWDPNTGHHETTTLGCWETLNWNQRAREIFSEVLTDLKMQIIVSLIEFMRLVLTNDDLWYPIHAQTFDKTSSNLMSPLPAVLLINRVTGETATLAIQNVLSVSSRS